MVKVTVFDETREYPTGVKLAEIAEQYQERFENDIVLAQVNGKLQELHKEVSHDASVSFLTASDRPGIDTYRRSALFLMLRAYYDVTGKKDVSALRVCFLIDSGLYFETAEKAQASPELMDRVTERMHELAEKKIPIYKRSVNTEDAVDLFHRHRMYDKERLFRYRRASRVNVYSIENFDDYFYGYMVPHTGYIKYFRLEPYASGFVLILPKHGSPKEIPAFAPSRKLFETQRESELWGEMLGLSDVGGLNNAIAGGDMETLILMQEALQEKKIGDIAEQIIRSGKKIVMIAGPSSSGKTSFSHRLSIQLAAHGMRPHPIATDNYFIDREKTPRDENGNYDFESLACLDCVQFNKDMLNLLAGKTVELPRYNFLTGKREYKGDYMKLADGDILVIEGIHCLNDAMSSGLSADQKFKIYISALTQLNIDAHNRIPTRDGRLIRRIIRDARTRGHSAQDTIRRWDSVRRGEERNIFPYQESADVMFNSALLYELAVLKQFAEPLLYSVPRECPEYMEAKRLLKFLDYFLGVSSEHVPNNSLLREFVGGSCFNV